MLRTETGTRAPRAAAITADFLHEPPSERVTVPSVLSPGQQVDGRFCLEQPLGAGAQADVWRARDIHLERHVALKVLRGSAATGLHSAARFRREAAMLARLRSAHLATIFGFGFIEGEPYFAMELVDGKSLLELWDVHLEAQRPMPLGRTVEIVADAARGLSVAHAQGIVHRDVKPENVMLTTSEPGAKLLDFGASLVREASTTGLTRPGIIIGTPEYLAPEQIVESETIDGRADVYALGLVLYRCVAGHLPYEARNVAGWMRAHVFSRPATLKGESPPALVRLLMRCLEKAPEKRPTMVEVRAELARIADRAGVPPFHELERELAEATVEEPPASATTRRESVA